MIQFGLKSFLFIDVDPVIFLGTRWLFEIFALFSPKTEKNEEKESVFFFAFPRPRNSLF
jgi:hypothetical protein